MFTPVKLDKTRNFKYGMRAIHLIEQTLETKISKLDLNELSMYQLSVIVWAGLFHEDRELTPELVMDIIDDYSNIPEVTEAMSKAFEASFGEGQSSKKKIQPKS